jgi:actin-like protein 6A
MYCGDETGSFIGDIGSHVARFGYGGEDSPKHVVPSYIARFNDAVDDLDSSVVVPTSCYSPRWASAQVSSALRMAKQSDPNDPVVVDPTLYLQQGDQVAPFDSDAYEQLWHSAFDALRVRDTRKHSTGGAPYSKTSTKGSGIQSTTALPVSPEGDTSTFSGGQCPHPLLVVTPGCTHRVGSTAYDASVHRKEQMQITELMMEQMQCRALFIAPTPMLAAFSHGRQTACVVDVGAGGCRVTPVVGGLPLKQSQRRSGRGGDWLGNIQWKALLQHPDTAGVRPRYQIDQKRHVNNTSHKNMSSLSTNNRGLFHRWAMQDLMYEFRTMSEYVHLPQWAYDPTVPFLNENWKVGGNSISNDDTKMEDDTTTSATTPSATYQLPDGTVVDLTTPLGKDLCRVPELFFTDETPFLPIDNTESNSILQEHATLSSLPLHKLIHSSLSAVGDVDARKELSNAIILCGGASLWPGLEQRLSLELSRTVASAFKTKVLASRYSVERSCAAWIGGSVVTSLGSFQQLWLSREEYEEYGATLAVQRFP